MSESNEQPKPKRKRALRTDQKVFTRSCLRTLKQKPEGSDDPWGEILSITLYEIAVHPDSPPSLRLQAIKTAASLRCCTLASRFHPSFAVEKPLSAVGQVWAWLLSGE